MPRRSLNRRRRLPGAPSEASSRRPETGRARLRLYASRGYPAHEFISVGSSRPIFGSPTLKFERQCRDKRRAPGGPPFFGRPLRRKAEFTGVGDLCFCFPPWCLSRNILRSIRESATPAAPQDEFSPLCPPFARAGLFCSPARKSHFFVIFPSWPKA